MDNTKEIEKFPNWIYLILPFLLGRQSKYDFEKWLYSREAMNCLSELLYLELISFNYEQNPLRLFDVLRNFLSLEHILSLQEVILFLNKEYVTECKFLYCLPMKDSYCRELGAYFNEILFKEELCEILKYENELEQIKYRLTTYLAELENYLFRNGNLPELSILDISDLFL